VLLAADAWTVFGDICTAIAAVAALVALMFAKLTVSDARRARQEALWDRRRQRLLFISALVDELTLSARREQGGPSVDWIGARNRLSQALTGVQPLLPPGSGPLPSCAEMATAATTQQVLAPVAKAHDEISAALAKIEFEERGTPTVEVHTTGSSPVVP
jgi:hypothetical protein